MVANSYCVMNYTCLVNWDLCKKKQVLHGVYISTRLRKSLEQQVLTGSATLVERERKERREKKVWNISKRKKRKEATRRGKRKRVFDGHIFIAFYGN